TRVGCSRRPAMGVPDEWPSRRGNPSDRTRLTGRLTNFPPRLSAWPPRSFRLVANPEGEATLPRKSAANRTRHMLVLAGSFTNASDGQPLAALGVNPRPLELKKKDDET